MLRKSTMVLSLVAAAAVAAAYAAGGPSAAGGAIVRGVGPAPGSADRTPGSGTRRLEAEWLTYKQPAFGYEIEYPSDWQVVEAAPKKSNKAQWAGNVLLGNEVQKTTFLETNHGIWQAEFQVSVEADTEGLGLEEWLRRNEPRDVTGGSLVQDRTDVTVDGRPAVRLSVFGFDREVVLIVLRHEKRIFRFDFSGRNPNDPEAAVHSAVFARMLGSFRLTD